MASHLLSLSDISRPTIATGSQNMSIATSPDQKTTGLKQEKEVVRRSGNYKPPICDNDFIQSLTSPYGEARFRKRTEDLKEYVRSLLEKKEDASESIELVDTLQRLGLSYLFENEIKTILQNKNIDHDKTKENDLHYTALKFRILRQHGFFISQDEFTSFLDENGVFKEALGDDVRAILSLHDASYTSLEGETLLEHARDFATRHLKRQASIKGNLSSELRELVERGLEFPYYWRSPRLEARWSIAWYERKEKSDAQLLELSKLDFNICQAGHQTNIKAISRWWMERGLAQLLPFSRDRLPESFLWSLGHIYDPKYSHATQWQTFVYQLSTTVDDIYDVYGTMAELECFTKAVERWDIDALDELPIYMRLCYLALLNFNNEMGYTTLKLQGWNIIPLLKKIWIDLCNAYLVEAKWFHEGYTPSFEDYKNNASISIVCPLALSTLFLLMNAEINNERLILLNNYQDIIQPTALACRLLDDLGTSNQELKRGDVPKAVQCYMHEEGVPEEVAEQHVKHMISDSWKKMNRYMVLGSSFPRDFVRSSMDALRAFQWFYRDGDGFGFQRGRTFDLFKILVVEPIPLGDEQD